LWPDLTLLERTMGASMRYCFILALVAVAFSFALSSVRAKIRVAQATTIAGSHGVVGTNPDDSTYSGTVVISNISDNQYRFDCSVGNGQSFTGTGGSPAPRSRWIGARMPRDLSGGMNGILAGTWGNADAFPLTPRDWRL
jgi:hypothetical protein